MATLPVRSESLNVCCSSAQQNGKMNVGASAPGKPQPERATQPWPPWRLPGDCEPQYRDPRLILHSKFAHGLIFNLLYKAVHTHGISENIMSLSVFLLELALSLPQTDFSGKELALSSPTPWYIVHEPVDLQYDTWFPTDFLSANLRHTVSAIFSSQPSSSSSTTGTTSMEVDPVSEGSSDESEATPYNVETPSSVVLDSPPPLLRPPGDNQNHLAITMTSPPGALVPVMPGTLETVRSLVARPLTQESAQPRALLAPSHSVLAQPAALPEQAAITTNQRSVVNINESIISLLLTLHSKLSGRPDSYIPYQERLATPSLAATTTEEYSQSRIGDGCFFLEKVLDRISRLDSACDQFIKVTRTQLWPTQHAREAELDIRQEQEQAEARRRRARERQARMMREFAERQQRFMRTAMETQGEEGEEEEEEPASSAIRHSEYYCVHCHQSQASTEEKPMGLVVLLQATSVLGHKHRDSQGLVLPTAPEEREAFAVEDSLAAEYERRFEELGRQFDPRSHLLAVNTGWQGGVFVQSCNHYVHLACHNGYMQSLRNASSNRSNSSNLAVEKGEYMCPMCRQLANSVLPIPPDMSGQVVRARSQCPVVLGHEVTALLREPPLSPNIQSQQSPLMAAMSQIMENLTRATYPQYRQVGSPHPNHAIILFVSSTARTNLELDLVTRGGALITAAGAAASPMAASSKPRSCFLPLLHVLAIHMKIMSLKPLVSDWCQVSGLWQDEDDRTLLVRENNVPLLLRDPVTLLLHLTLILPVHLDRAFYTSLVRQLYNLTWVQSCLKVACRLPAHHRNSLRDDWRLQAASANNPLKVDTLQAGLGLLTANLDSCGLFSEELDPARGPQSADLLPQDVTGEQIEARVQTNCLPYLRIAALLRHYVYNEQLPDIWEQDWEFTRLAQFLGMADLDMSGRVSSAPCLGWLVPPADLVTAWTGGLESFSSRGQLAARKLVMTNNIWRQPQLLKLPRNYDSIFQVLRPLSSVRPLG